MLNFSTALRAPLALALLTLGAAVFPASGQPCGTFSTASPYFGPVTLQTGVNTTVGRRTVAAKDSSGDTVFYHFSVTGSLLGQQTVASSCFDSETPQALSLSPQPTATATASNSAVAADFNNDGAPDAAVLDGVSNVLVYLSQSGSLQLSATYPVGNGPRALVAADVNGDGIQDLIVGNFGAGTVSVLLGTSGGKFQAPVTYGVSGHPVALVVASSKSGGSADIVVASCGNTACSGTSAKAGFVSVLAGKGDGTFSNATIALSNVYPLSLISGDFNGDGQLDIAYGDGSANAVMVLLGNGAGSFGIPTAYNTGSEPDFLGRGDFNGDGYQDLAVLNTSSGTVTLLYGRGAGLFSAGQAYLAANAPVWFTFGDFNADGKLDLVTSDSQTGNLEFLLGHAGNTFLAPRAYAESPGPTLVAAGDFNGDGNPDFVISNLQSGTMQVFLGAGSGTFTTGLSISLPPGETPLILKTADFNKDGKADLLIGSTDGVFLALGNAQGLSAPRAASLSGGSATVSPIGLAIADFNGDGTPDFAVLTTSTAGGAIIGVYTGDGKGSFTSIYSANQTVITPVGIGAPDLNGDGKADLVILDAGGFNPITATLTAGAVDVLLNTSAGTAFATAVAYAAGTSPTNLVAADFNKDGKLDLAVLTNDSQGNSNIALLLGGDSGKLNGAVFFGVDGGAGNIVTADFNGDGKPDIAVTASTGVNLLLGDGTGKFGALGRVPSGIGSQGLDVADFNSDAKPDLVVASTGGSNLAGSAVVLLNRAAIQPQSLTVVNGASFASGPLAPLSIASAFGSSLATQTVQATSLTQSLGGTSLTVTDSTGTARAANLFFVSPGQVNFQVPDGSAAGLAVFAVQRGGNTVASGFVNIVSVGPGLFTADGRVAVGQVIHADSSGGQTSADLSACTAGVCTSIPIDVSAASGSAVLVLYGTGIRGATLAQVTVQVGGVTLTPVYAGAQADFAGLDQVNVVLPPSLQGSGDVAVTVTAAGVTSNGARVVIQ